MSEEPESAGTPRATPAVYTIALRDHAGRAPQAIFIEAATDREARQVAAVVIGLYSHAVILREQQVVAELTAEQLRTDVTISA